MERRSVLSTLAAMAVAAIAALVFLPALAYLLSPLRRREEAGAWIDIGPLDAVPEGTPVPAAYEVTLADGWARRSRPASAWLIRRGGDLRVLTSTCPHLGCAVRWLREEGRFACPCHASSFAADGRRLAGPAPRDLDPLPSRVERGRILVRHVAYRSGVSGRVQA